MRPRGREGASGNLQKVFPCLLRLELIIFLLFPQCFQQFFILVAPDEVVITGQTEVKADQIHVYRCEAKNANPAPKIQWIGMYCNQCTVGEMTVFAPD
jgi:hypothetical protein